MPITPYSKVAFRCRNCGRLHTSDDAAQASHPHACRVCGHGTIFSTDGRKHTRTDNWEKLWEATPDRLTELGLNAADVEQHTPWPVQPATREPVKVEVSATDGPGTTDGI